MILVPRLFGWMPFHDFCCSFFVYSSSPTNNATPVAPIVALRSLVFVETIALLLFWNSSDLLLSYRCYSRWMD